jgi:hypothetical protein
VGQRKQVWGVEVGLAEREAALATAIRTGAPVPCGRVLGLPELADGRAWVDMAGAVAISRHPQGTITGWITRAGPKYNPFPMPYRVLYRLWWPEDEVRAWRAISDALLQP